MTSIQGKEDESKMKRKLPVGVSVLLALVLVAFGVLYGTGSGFSADRAEVMDLFQAENGLRDVLLYRAADGLNLCVVAKRHLGEDHELVKQLEAAARELQSAESPAWCFDADSRMDELIRMVRSEMIIQRSFEMSVRDQRYLDMLASDLNNLSASAAATGYNEAAAAFNEQLEEPLFGMLARYMGMKPFVTYAAHASIPAMN